MRIGSLASGYGGLDLAVMAELGGTVAWHADIDKGAGAVLAARWPGVPNLGDMAEIRWEDVRLASMPAHRCDELAQQMYDRYCQGLSLDEVAREFSKTRQSVWKMFDRRGWSMRPVRGPARLSVSHDGYAYSLGDNGYLRATTEDRHLLHRRVWEQAHGPIPEGHDIHHRDHDKLNNSIANLECLSKAEHAKRYNLGCNGFAHKCGLEVMPSDSPAVDVLTAGYP